jgi:hypothetical protein
MKLKKSQEDVNAYMPPEKKMDTHVSAYIRIVWKRGEFVKTNLHYFAN